MGKTQTRRSISIRGETYDRLRAWCEGHHESMSEFLERRIEEHIGPQLRGKAYRPLPAVGVGARAQEKRAQERVSSPVPAQAPVPVPPIPPVPPPAAHLPPIRPPGIPPAPRAAIPPPRPASPPVRAVPVLPDPTDHRGIRF